MENSLSFASVQALAAALVAQLKEKKLTLATAESCTGGMIGAFLTTLPGVSAVYLGGVVAYANEVKEALLGVSGQTLATVGAVSRETAAEMAEGVRRRTGASLAVSVTGIAGPDGGSEKKPVGLVYVSVCDGHTTLVSENDFSGGRDEVRLKTVHKALTLLCEAAERHA